MLAKGNEPAFTAYHAETIQARDRRRLGHLRGFEIRECVFYTAKVTCNVRQGNFPEGVGEGRCGILEMSRWGEMRERGEAELERLAEKMVRGWSVDGARRHGISGEQELNVNEGVTWLKELEWVKTMEGLERMDYDVDKYYKWKIIEAFRKSGEGGYCTRCVLSLPRAWLSDELGRISREREEIERLLERNPKIVSEHQRKVKKRRLCLLVKWDIPEDLMRLVWEMLYEK